MKKENPPTQNRVVDYQIDNLDRQILSLLMNDTRRPYSDIAQELNISNGTVHVRMKRLIDAGIVTGTHLAVDVRKLGFDIIAFVGLSLEKATKYPEVIAAMKNVPEIVEVYHVTGTYSLLLKLICRDSGHLLQTLREKVQVIKSVGRTEIFILLEEGIRRSLDVNE